MKKGDHRAVILAGGISSRMKSPSVEMRIDPELREASRGENERND